MDLWRKELKKSRICLNPSNEGETLNLIFFDQLLIPFQILKESLYMKRKKLGNFPNCPLKPHLKTADIPNEKTAFSISDVRAKSSDV